MLLPLLLVSLLSCISLSLKVTPSVVQHSAVLRDAKEKRERERERESISSAAVLACLLLLLLLPACIYCCYYRYRLFVLRSNCLLAVLAAAAC